MEQGKSFLIVLRQAFSNFFWHTTNKNVRLSQVPSYLHSLTLALN